MSFSITCNCRGRLIVDQCLRFVQDYGENGQWLEGNEWGLYHSAHESSSEAADQDEPLWIVSDVDGDFDGGWDVGRNGRRDSRSDVGQEDGLNGQWNGRYNGEVVVVRVDTWDGTPHSSYRSIPVEFLFYWSQRCQWCEIRDFAYGQYSTAHAVHHDHHGYINNGSSDSVGFSGAGDRPRRDGAWP